MKINRNPSDFNDLPLWQSALVGHHKAGTSREALEKWLLQDHIRNAGDSQHELAADFWIMANVVDRMPDDRFPRLLEKLEKHGWQITRDKDGRAILIGDVVKGSPQDNGSPTPADFAAVRANPHGQYVETPRVYFAEAYTLLRHGKYKEANAKFHDELTDRLLGYFQQKNFNIPWNTWQMPYIAWAAAMAGEAVDIDSNLDTVPSDGRDFYWYLAKAFAAAGKYDDKAALDNLNAALNRRQYTQGQPVLTEYQFAEACEALYEWRHAKPYRDMALDWAKKYEVIQPLFAWPYALEAKFTDSETDRTRALGFALYLDRNARMISGFDDAERKKASDWFAKHKPFILPTKSGTEQTM